MPPAKPLTVEEHRARHIELHKALDELFADFIRCQPADRIEFLQTPVQELIEWSFRQTLHPELPRT